MPNLEEISDSNPGCLTEMKNDVRIAVIIHFLAAGVTFACMATMGNTAVGRLIFDRDTQNTSQNYNNAGSSDSKGFLGGIFQEKPPQHCTPMQRSSGGFNCTN